MYSYIMCEPVWACCSVISLYLTFKKGFDDPLYITTGILPYKEVYFANNYHITILVLGL